MALKFTYLQIPINDKQEFTEVQRDVLREYEELVKELVRQTERI